MSDKLREALMAHEKKVIDMVLSCQKDPTDVYLTSTEVLESRYAFLAALADSATIDKPDCCSICAGTRKTLTGEPCICKTGTIYGELDALRRAALAAPQEPTDEMVFAVVKLVLGWVNAQKPHTEYHWPMLWREVRATLAGQQKGEG